MEKENNEINEEIVTKQEFIEFKEELLNEVYHMRIEDRNFRRQIALALNMIFVGLGFVVADDGHLKGFISFVLFYGYMCIWGLRYGGFYSLVVYIPALVIWIVSQVMLMCLDD